MNGDSECSDEKLWRLVINGDGDAFGAMFDRHRDRVLRHALRLLGSPHAAEDVTAIVFYETWRRREYVRMVNGSIVAWLLVTANNTIRNEIRQRRRYRNLLVQLPPPGAGPDVADEFADADEREAQALGLRQAFERLRPMERDVLTLCVVERLSVRETATALKIAEGTVKSRLHRAKARLGILYQEVSTEHAIDYRAAHGRRES